MRDATAVDHTTAIMLQLLLQNFALLFLRVCSSQVVTHTTSNSHTGATQPHLDAQQFATYADHPVITVLLLAQSYSWGGGHRHPHTTPRTVNPVCRCQSVPRQRVRPEFDAPSAIRSAANDL